MEMDIALSNLLFERWTNNACRGYVIKAMENLDFKPEDIHNIISELRFLFDICSIEQADQYYCNGSY